MLHTERQQLVSMVTNVDDLVEHLFSLDDAARALHLTGAHTKSEVLGAEIASLSQQTQEGLAWLKSSLAHQKAAPQPNLTNAIFRVESSFAHLSEEGVLQHFEPTELLHLCSFLFNLREVARETTEMLDLSIKKAKLDKASEAQRNRELEQVYLRTAYEVDGPEGKFALRIDQTSPALETVLSKHGKRTWAYLTAYNPGSETRSEEENINQQQQLETDVRSAGYASYLGRGVSDDKSWPPEESLLVLGIDRTVALSLAKSYCQRAILFGEAGGKVQLVWV